MKKPSERPERNMSPVILPRDPDRSLAWAWAGSKEKVVRKKAPPRVHFAPAVRVERGAAWLDQLVPTWFHRIPPHLVDVQSVRFCPLSNAFPDERGWPCFPLGVRQLCRPERLQVKSSSPSSGLHALPGRRPIPRGDSFRGSSTDQLAHFGFAPYHDEQDADPYPTMNACWRAEIEKRIAAKAPKS